MDIGCPDSPESEPYDDESNRSGGEPSSPHDSEEPLDLSRSPISCMDSGPEEDEDGDGSEPSMDPESAPCGPEGVDSRL